MKIFTALSIIAISLFAILYIFRQDNRVYLSLPLENHPEVIAVEKMIDKTSASVQPKMRKKIALAIVSNGKFYSVPYKQLVAIAYVESTFRPNLVSDTGDYGICQVNWSWWGKKFVSRKEDLFNIYKNVEVACKIINANRNMGYRTISSYHSLKEEHRIIYESKLAIALRRI